MDRKAVNILVLLDQSAALNTIDHKTMAEQQESDLSLTDKALFLIILFFFGGKQCVVVKQQHSCDYDVNGGVPQGSCVGP